MYSVILADPEDQPIIRIRSTLDDLDTAKRFVVPEGYKHEDTHKGMVAYTLTQSYLLKIFQNFNEEVATINLKDFGEQCDNYNFADSETNYFLLMT
jgi:hypothetical protein